MLFQGITRIDCFQLVWLSKRFHFFILRNCLVWLENCIWITLQVLCLTEGFNPFAFARYSSSIDRNGCIWVSCGTWSTVDKKESSLWNEWIQWSFNSTWKHYLHGSCQFVFFVYSSNKIFRSVMLILSNVSFVVVQLIFHHSKGVSFFIFFFFFFWLISCRNFCSWFKTIRCFWGLFCRNINCKRYKKWWVYSYV